MLYWESMAYLAVLVAISIALVWAHWWQSRRTRGIQTFFASVTHELRTPLTSVRLQAESIADSLAEEGRNLLARLLPSMQSAFGGARSIFAFFTHLAIIPVYLFLFLLASPPERSVWERQLSFLSPGLRADLVFLGHEFVAIIESFFREIGRAHV